ncbi:MAG TPA: KamA family radical SAM protein [Candidatus Krumholzibacteria bacterium]|nr:KamA family radical SAM protein [Candidatus Krumholzibacteria bacterium]
MRERITPKYITRLEQVPQLNDAERERLQPVHDAFVFRTNDYYQSLIDWNDPDDPIRRIVMPDTTELEPWGRLDASNEADYTRVPGLEHKYRSTALLLVNDVCGAYCRFCFRKRLFMDDNDEVVRDVSQGIAYIREHREITNVLLTGGDPLLMSTRLLRSVIEPLRAVEHVQIIRIGSKMPAFNPFRILDDPSLCEMLREFSTPAKRIYVMCHFNHPRELTDEAIEGLARLQEAGVITVNQTPLIAGVNDDPMVLAELFRKCSFVGMPPYYVFQCRPTLGNRGYTVPVERGYQIVEAAKARVSGLAKRARFVMSHETGKIEVIALTSELVVFKYHRAADDADSGRVMVYGRNPDATWFDDYTALVELHAPEPMIALVSGAADERDCCAASMYRSARARSPDIRVVR